MCAAGLVAGGLLLVRAALPGRPALAARAVRAAGGGPRAAVSLVPSSLAGPLARAAASYGNALRQAGEEKTLSQLLTEKALLAAALPLVPLLPYSAAAGRFPPLSLVLLLALIGFALPDLALRRRVRQRRESLSLDLPDAIALLALALAAGHSLRQALTLAARDCPGPLGQELEGALTLARRERGVDERQALARLARESGAPQFARFAELLATKESPYLDFLRDQAAQARAEQARYLERAADRAYLAMHAPVAPLLATLVLLVAYGFLHTLGRAI